MQVQPYLLFDGRCEEAVEFYRRTLGAEAVTVLRWKDMPNPQGGAVPPDRADKIMHAQLRIGDSEVMASDGECGGAPQFSGFSLALKAADPGEAQRLFAALAEGGQVRMPLSPTFFSPAFGMLTDRFGVSWMVHVPQ